LSRPTCFDEGISVTTQLLKDKALPSEKTRHHRFGEKCLNFHRAGPTQESSLLANQAAAVFSKGDPFNFAREVRPQAHSPAAPIL
jgi:hypothetical protein